MGEAKGPSEDLDLLIKLAREAGKIGMDYFSRDIEVWYKDGNSPVTEADREIDQFLRDSLSRERPEYGWLSEETADTDRRLSSNRVVIVDPIDGTRGFISGDKRWCISIAIVEDGRPIEGLLFAPALGQLFAAGKSSGLILENASKGTKQHHGKPRVTGSKKLIERLQVDYTSSFEVSEFIPSLAYRLAMVATGHLDGAFARPGASEWDVAAADIILAEAGAHFTDNKSQNILYNQSNVRLPSLIAAGKSSYEDILGLAKPLGILH